MEPLSEFSVSVVITGVGPDFTRMESLGTVDAFAETLVGFIFELFSGIHLVSSTKRN